MDNDEIKKRIFARIDQDAEFTQQLSDALEIGAWEIVAKLIQNAVGFVLEKAGQFWEWLKREFS
jgi:hypothetical protein